MQTQTICNSNVLLSRYLHNDILSMYFRNVNVVFRPLQNKNVTSVIYFYWQRVTDNWLLMMFIFSLVCSEISLAIILKMLGNRLTFN